MGATIYVETIFSALLGIYVGPVSYYLTNWEHSRVGLYKRFQIGVVPEYPKVSGVVFLGTWILAELCLIASNPSVCLFLER